MAKGRRLAAKRTLAPWLLSWFVLVGASPDTRQDNVDAGQQVASDRELTDSVIEFRQYEDYQRQIGAVREKLWKSWKERTEARITLVFYSREADRTAATFAIRQAEPGAWVVEMTATRTAYRMARDRIEEDRFESVFDRVDRLEPLPMPFELVIRGDVERQSTAYWLRFWNTQTGDELILEEYLPNHVTHIRGYDK